MNPTPNSLTAPTHHPSKHDHGSLAEACRIAANLHAEQIRTAETCIASLQGMPALEEGTRLCHVGDPEAVITQEDIRFHQDKSYPGKVAALSEVITAYLNKLKDRHATLARKFADDPLYNPCYISGTHYPLAEAALPVIDPVSGCYDETQGSRKAQKLYRKLNYCISQTPQDFIADEYQRLSNLQDTMIDFHNDMVAWLNRQKIEELVTCYLNQKRLSLDMAYVADQSPLEHWENILGMHLALSDSFAEMARLHSKLAKLQANGKTAPVQTVSM